MHRQNPDVLIVKERGFIMQLTPEMFLIVCPFLFLAGFVDAIAGGGGLISLPAYLLVGLPPHYAIGTNKLSSSCGTLVATLRFLKSGMVLFKVALPSVAAAIAGSAIGSHLSLSVDEQTLRYVLFVILPVSAFFVLNKNMFSDKGKKEAAADTRTIVTAVASAFLIGIYDGFYGPGTGTFLIIAFTVFAHMNVPTANAQAKVINLTTNITALVVFILNGQVLFMLGADTAACNILGNYLGSGLAISKGSAIARPVIIGVLILLLIKVLTG